MATLSKSDYLKRYKSAGSAHEKKKKKNKEEKDEKPPKKQLNGMRIIETDAFASVASAHDVEDYDSDEELEIRMLNEEIRNKAKKGGMKGGFKSTFTTIDDGDVKTEPLDDHVSSGTSEPQVKTEPDDNENKFTMALDKTKTKVTTQRKRHDSDQSPPRTQRKRHDSDQSPPRTQRKRHDSDQSPPRTQRKRHDSDSSNSPPRKRRYDSNESPPKRRQRRNSDQSPPRARTRKDSDQSPPRSRKRKDSDQSPPRLRRLTSPGADSKQKTLEGKVAGLQSAKELREESDRLRARETQMFDELDSRISGRDAETTYREKIVKRGRKEKPEDLEKKEREAKKQAELAEKYKEWNRGVKQLQDREAQLAEMERVVSGPMTRTAEDVDMNKYLKDVIHESDPMAAFIRKKNKEEAIDRGDLVYPTYDKPYPPNRYGIRPGYRWDGVDRSNGFESKLAISQNARQAVEKEMYSNSNVFE